MRTPFPFLLVTILGLCACAPTASSLRKLSPAMTKAEVLMQLGEPLSTGVFRGSDGSPFEVWNYRLYRYSGAIEGVSPFFDIYSLLFVRGELVEWRKTGGPTEADFENARAFVGAMSAASNSFRSPQPVEAEESYRPPNRATYGSGSYSCGIKPFPEIGCRIGRCVDGAWEQICDSAPTLSCGIKPIPEVGCRIGRCVNGAWEQVCN